MKRRVSLTFNPGELCRTVLRQELDRVLASQKTRKDADGNEFTAKTERKLTGLQNRLEQILQAFGEVKK